MPPTRTLWPTPRSGWVTRTTPAAATCCYPGSLGAQDWARGHLVELYWRLGGVAWSLHYRELLTRHPHDPDRVAAHLPIVIEVTARLRTSDGQAVTVVSREVHTPFGPSGDRWTITVNGEIPRGSERTQLNGEQTTAPALPWLAFLVDHHLRRGARADAGCNDST